MMRLIPIVLLGLAWETFARSGAVTPFMLPPLSDVLARIYDDAVGGDLFLNAGRTVVELAKRWYEQDDESALPRSIATRAHNTTGFSGVRSGFSSGNSAK